MYIEKLTIDEEREKYLELFKKELLIQKLMSFDEIANTIFDEETIDNYIFNNRHYTIRVQAYIFCKVDIPYQHIKGIENCRVDEYGFKLY